MSQETRNKGLMIFGNNQGNGVGTIYACTGSLASGFADDYIGNNYIPSLFPTILWDSRKDTGRCALTDERIEKHEEKLGTVLLMESRNVVTELDACNVKYEEHVGTSPFL
ncbi:hypothetical protein U3516DRAFT_741205 [Neocallimastix sp. 'constans']